MNILEVKDLRQSYGGLSILEGITFDLAVGEKMALIGPNGAGKTTLFNVLSGIIPARSGQIVLSGHDITRKAAFDRAKYGMARSFQISRLFMKMSLLDNVMLAVHAAHASWRQMLRPMANYKSNVDRARELLEDVDLWQFRDEPVAFLGHGQQRQVEIILALACKPKLLLLDEPNAGLTRAESDNLISLIQNLVGDTSVLLTAHDTDLVFKLATQVLVLYYGRILACGAPEEIQANPKVREIYLGIDEEAGA